MFSLQEFKQICEVLTKNGISVDTPLQIMSYLRKYKKPDSLAIKILSNAFEKMPGYGNELVEDFIGIIRGKTLVE